MQHDLAVPEVLLQLSRSHNPSFLGDMSFRVLNLRAAIKRGLTSDPKFICDTARQMDRELEAWRVALTPSMNYEIVDNAPDITHFNLGNIRTVTWRYSG
jgi:hypothetical protein